MGGWPGERRTNNMLVYSAWMQMIDWGHKLGGACETKGVLHRSRALTVSPWDSSLLPEGRVWSGPSSPRSDVRHSVMAASSLPCCVSLQILILKVQTGGPRGGTADSTTERRERESERERQSESEGEGAPLRVLLHFWKKKKKKKKKNWGRRGWKRRERRERNVWVDDHTPIFLTAVQQAAWVHECVNMSASVLFISCQTHGGIHSKWKECALYILFQLCCPHPTKWDAELFYIMWKNKSAQEVWCVQEGKWRQCR